MKQAFHLLLVLLSFMSVSFAAELPDLFSKSDGGFADAELRAENIDRTSDGNLVITAVVRTGKENVGFRVILASKWEPWKPQGFPGTLHRGTVRIETLGKQTEFFVRALARAYAQRIERYDFTSVRLTAISLEGDPRHFPVRLKLFYES